MKLLEKDYTTIDAEQGVINLFDGNEFKDIDYLKNTISLQENYDGKIATTTITFEIPFNNYKPSWQYNLLEFDQNLYVAHITPKSSESGIFAGYEHGLQPSYEINGNTSIGESTSIKITLTEASEWGIFELDTWSYYRDSSKRWIGVDSEHICVEFGIGAYLLMQEVDGNGTPTGRYKCLEGYENRYSNYNIVETYDEAPRFASSDCARSMARRVNSDTYYTCVDGDKYSIKFTEISYDNKKSWVRISKYELGDLVEADSSFCEIEPQYKWAISDEWDCISQFERWIPSGTTCIDGNKYQNNYKQVSDDYIHWVNSNPLEWSASTVIEYDTDDCKSYRWVETDDIMCVETPVEFRTISGEPYCEGCDLYVNVEDQITYDSGTTWQTIELHKNLYEKYAFECGGDCDINFDEEYLSFVALEDGTFSISQGSAYYSLDDGATWTHLANGTTPTIKMGETVKWKDEKNNSSSGGSYAGFGTFSSSGKFDVFGNIMSLVYGDNFSGQTDLATRGYAFSNLFSGSSVSSANNLRLPATVLNHGSYWSMFASCASLRTAKITMPNLSSVSGGLNFYEMFKGCTSLITGPQSLSSSILGFKDYASMFEGCTSLTTVPSLPATSLTEYCYASMFKGCTSLTTAPELPTETLVQNCYASMFEGCTSLTTAPVLSATTLAENCYNSMFLNCTSLTTAPELTATTLANICYSYMFKGCTSLINPPSVLPAERVLGRSVSQGAYQSMFEGCTALTHSPQILCDTIEWCGCKKMFYGCTSLSAITCTALTINRPTSPESYGGVYQWVYGVAANGTFTKAASMTGWSTGNNGIPNGWTVTDYTN